jgi:hypothetical protein
VFPVRYGQTYRVELSLKQKAGRWIMSSIVIAILIYHRHKPIDLIYGIGVMTYRMGGTRGMHGQIYPYMY